MYQKHNHVLRYFVFVLVTFLMAFIIIDSNKKICVVTSNVNNVKSIQSSRIFIEKDVEKVKVVKSVAEIKAFGKTHKIEFKGTLTGYGPDCPGCLGMVYCSPNPNVQNGKIFYDDKTYGNIRILAADYSIPCGSIIKIENFKFISGKEFYGIVLDRGSAIVGLTMDLLYPSEEDTVIIGRQKNINFTIERWGW